MCGIFLVYSKVSNLKLNKVNCIASAKKMRNRGPDILKYQFFENERLFLANSVLSLTGTYSKSQKLICSESRRKKIIYNGEIYNYKKLNNRYFKNKNFKNDTSLIVNMYEKFNFDIPKKFNGMFAYVVYDQFKRNFEAVVDPQGEKTLYYYNDVNYFIISSTIKSLLFFLKKKNIEKESLKNYFRTRHFILNPQNIFENIATLHNGFKINFEIKNNKFKLKEIDDPIKWISKKKYFNFQNKDSTKIENIFYKKLLNQCKMMIPQKKFACVVSGGIDSTLQYAFISRFKFPNLNLIIDHKKKDNAIKNIKKFKKYLIPKIKILKMDKKKYKKILFSLYKKTYTPLFTHDNPGRFLISKFCRNNKSPIVFTGDGCDEILGGYELNYKFFKKIKKFKQNNSVYSSAREISNLKNNNHLDKFLNSQWMKIYNKYNFIENEKERSIQSSLLMDYLVNAVYCFNRATDLIISENSVENRNIFIQKDILKFIVNLPLKYKINFREKNPKMRTKYILKRIFLRFFSNDLIFKKEGFSGFPNEFSVKEIKSFKKKVNNMLNINNLNLKSIKKNYYDKFNFERDFNWKYINLGLFLKKINVFK